MNTQQLNDLKGFLSFERTWQLERFIRMPQKVIGLFTGNQSMKTSSTAYQYVLRVLGMHPVPKKNVVYFECSTRNKDNLSPHGHHTFIDGGVTVMGWEAGTWTKDTVPKDLKCPFCGADIVIHQRNKKVFRFASENLPGDKDSAGDKSQSTEVRNTTYPEFKKWLPPFLVKRDIRFRSMSMIVHDPLTGMTFGTGENKIYHAGGDIVVEFVSYSQAVQAGAGVQRMSIWCDEEPSKEFWDEQLPRLVAEDGDIILSLTPANKMSWSFDDLYEKASIYYRTSSVCEYLNQGAKSTADIVKPVETTSLKTSVGCMQAATDDNPTLGKEIIEELYDQVADPDTLATRRYGIHRQVSGRIFKDFDYRIHFIDAEHYFPDGMFTAWKHFLLVDFHEHNPWAVMFITLSPHNEAFVWWEWSPSPEKYVSRVIAHDIALKSAGYNFEFSLIDPLAAKNQTNTSTSTIDDLNEYFWDFKKEGICGRHNFESWDTKATSGRDAVRNRLKWSKIVKRPFNNLHKEPGREFRVPTLWVLNNCKQTAQSLKQWRMEEWTRASDNINRERKETPSQKFSHFCMCLEAAHKDSRFKPPLPSRRPKDRTPKYFQGRRAA
jgi:phage terminase large subunit-like protein